MLLCPNCSAGLTRVRGPLGAAYACGSCGGLAVSNAILRRAKDQDAVRDLWRQVHQNRRVSDRRCPFCEKPAALVETKDGIILDLCARCAFLWFDPGEIEKLPAPPPQPPPRPEVSSATRQALALAEVKHIAERHEAEVLSVPDTWLEFFLGMLGLPLADSSIVVDRRPYATWILAALISLASITAFFFPAVLALALAFPLGLLMHAFFHADFFHLAVNLYFFLLLGHNVEDRLGRRGFTALFLRAALLGAMVHLAIDEHGLIGASSAVSGIIVFHALSFPRRRLLIPVGWGAYFRWWRLPIWGALIAWLFYQSLGFLWQLGGFGSVSHASHLGGTLAGFCFWIVDRRNLGSAAPAETPDPTTLR